MPYPLPKLDLVSGPGRSQEFAAMENWGAIFGFDRYLLVDPEVSTQADNIETYIAVAHEMAHQWFGDLVTMNWWNDLWLNEGFAQWMQYKAIDHFHPEWEPWLLALMEREQAMELDSGAGTHPIITPVADVLQANNAFDSITYDKGMSVIRMLERHVGEHAFRDAIRRYIRAHAYGNAVTDDLWQQLDQSAGGPISAMAHEFTLQPGITPDPGDSRAGSAPGTGPLCDGYRGGAAGVARTGGRAVLHRGRMARHCQCERPLRICRSFQLRMLS